MRAAACLLFPALLAAQADLSQWRMPPAMRTLGYTSEARREGCHSAGCIVLLPPDTLAPGAFGNLMQTLDAAPYRGRKLSLSAWLRTEPRPSGSGPESRAQLWMRIVRSGRALGFYDDSGDRPATAREWKRYEIAGEVAEDAESIQIGVLSFGKARVWINGVELHSGAPPGPEETSARHGIELVYGAIDAAYRRGDLSDVQGRATPDAQMVMGQTRSPLAAALGQVGDQLRKGTRIESRSTVTSVALSDAGAVVTVNNDSLMTGASTRELLSVSRDSWVRSEEGWKLRETVLISSREVTPRTDAAAAGAVAAELQQGAAPLGDTDGDAGLAAFGKAVGDARIVALGEATHGTSEFYTLNQRLLEYLVREKGFTVLAIEANWPEALGIDRYIKTGEGDPKKLLAGMNFWTWYTQEMLALVEWMRAYNQSPGEHAQLTFTSFDMQFGHQAADRAMEYLKEYAPDLGAVAQAIFGQAYDIEAHPGLYTERAEAVASQIANVGHEFDARHRTLTEASGEEKWRDARQAISVVQQACSFRIAGRGPGFRDQAMAGNAAWLAGMAFPRDKIVLWAHNAHVSAAGEPKPMGAFLRERFGRQMYVVGYAFHRGGLRAKGPEGGGAAEVKTFEAPPSPEGSGDAVLSAAARPVFFLDFATVPPATALARWLAEPHLFHRVGSSWFPDDPDVNLEPAVLAKKYDGLIFIEEGHAAHPL